MIIIRNNPKYSEAFKSEVLMEIESGKISIEGARRKYGIGGSMTISNWRKKSVNYAIKETSRAQMEDKIDIEELKAKNATLQRQLLEKDTELLICKTMIEITEVLKDPATKKKIEQELLKRLAEKKEKQMEEDIQSESCANITE